MKTLLLFLATLTVALSPAYALICHVCNNSNNCKNPQQCPSGYSYCKTVTSVEPLSGNLVRKSCEASCTPSNSQQGLVSSSTEATRCCQEDLCNEKLTSAGSAATPLSSATFPLVPALGLLALLLGPCL